MVDKQEPRLFYMANKRIGRSALSCLCAQRIARKSDSCFQRNLDDGATTTAATNNRRNGASEQVKSKETPAEMRQRRAFNSRNRD